MSRAPQFPAGYFDVDFKTAIRETTSKRDCMRFSALAMLQKRRPVAEVASVYGVCRHTIHQWLKRFKTGGIDAVKSRKIPGPQWCFSEEELPAFREAVKKLQQDRSGGSVTGEDIRTMLQEKFGIARSLSAVYKLLRHAGMSWVSGRSKHPCQDKVAQEAFKKTSWNASVNISPRLWQ